MFYYFNFIYKLKKNIFRQVIPSYNYNSLCPESNGYIQNNVYIWCMFQRLSQLAKNYNNSEGEFQREENLCSSTIYIVYIHVRPKYLCVLY